MGNEREKIKPRTPGLLSLVEMFSWLTCAKEENFSGNEMGPKKRGCLMTSARVAISSWEAPSTARSVPDSSFESHGSRQDANGVSGLPLPWLSATTLVTGCYLESYIIKTWYHLHRVVVKNSYTWKLCEEFQVSHPKLV